MIQAYEAHRLLHHSTLGLRVIKKKESKVVSTGIMTVPNVQFWMGS